MNIFHIVKETVTARQAAEHYGIRVNKNGMICCPFHNDRHPSMKVDKGFYCFACGAKGDVISFVSKLFCLTPLEAAKKLAEDFQVPIEKGSPKKGHALKKTGLSKRTLYQTEQKFEEWEKYCILILSEYLHLLENWKVLFAPKSQGEEWKDEFVEACHQLGKVNYYLDLLLNGELQDRIGFLVENGKDVEKIEKRMEKYRRKYDGETERSIRSERGNI